MIEYTIYISNDLVSNGLIHSSSSPDFASVISPELKVELNKSGSLNFTMLPNHSLYDYILPMKTLVTVYEDDDLLFRGRVIEATPDFYKQKKVVCEGDLSFLLDSIVQPFEYTKNGGKTIREVFKHIVGEHNSQVESWKQFSYNDAYITVTKGPDNSVTDKDTFNYTSYSDSSSALESCLLNEYGGVLRTRTIGNTTYLDYIKDPSQNIEGYPESGQDIEFAVNLLDFSSSYPVDDIFTVLLPTGKDKLKIGSVNNNDDYLVNQDAVNKFGIIVRHEEWSDISDAAELKKKAQRYLNEQSALFPNDLEITAIDMHAIDPTIDRLCLGDRIHCYSELNGIDTTLVCISISYDLTNPETKTYKIGSFIPSSNYQGKTSNKTSESSRGGSKSRSSSGKSTQAAKATDNLAQKEETDNRTNLKNAMLITGNQVRDLKTGEISTLTEEDLLDINNNLKLPKMKNKDGTDITIRDLCTTTADTLVTARNISLIAGDNITIGAGDELNLGSNGNLKLHSQGFVEIVGDKGCVTEAGEITLRVPGRGGENQPPNPSTLIQMTDDIVNINARKIVIGDEETDEVTINADRIDIKGLIETIVIQDLEVQGTATTGWLFADKTISAQNLRATDTVYGSSFLRLEEDPNNPGYSRTVPLVTIGDVVEYIRKNNIVAGGLAIQDTDPVSGSIVNYNVATETWVNTQLESYATRTWVNTKLESYATKTWVNNKGYGYTTIRGSDETIWPSVHVDKAWITDNNGTARFVYYDPTA